MIGDSIILCISALRLPYSRQQTSPR